MVLQPPPLAALKRLVCLRRWPTVSQVAAHLAARAAKGDPGFHLDGLSGDRMRLEFPLPKRVLDISALHCRRADHVHVLHGSVGADDDAHRDRRWRGAHLSRLDLLHYLLAGRVVSDADGRGPSGREGEPVEATHEALPLLRAA